MKRPKASSTTLVSTAKTATDKVYVVLENLIQARLDQIGQSEENAVLLKATGIHQDRLTQAVKQMDASLCKPDSVLGVAQIQRKQYLRKLVEEGGVPALDRELVRRALDHVLLERTFNESQKHYQELITDLRYPFEFYPAARRMHRKIHLHVGPTNSGKTYNALKRLEEAKTGVYAGPLRLLAHEVYERLNAKGKACNLITGDERRIQDKMKHYMSSCTVEMVPLMQSLDVAVIDEIQMLGSRDRGWAWTQAFLGVQAKEVHLCGEERVVPLIQALTAGTGDTLEIHKYERLSPLKVESVSLGGDLKALQTGDCVVCFSRANIYAIKQRIESSLGTKCAVIYGSLPPETRAQQARLFNDPNSGYDILVASDAIGMGLNL